MKLIVQAKCDIGLVRTTNEDVILVGNETLRDVSASYEFEFASSEYPFLIAVADGMGGHKGGAYASAYVVAEMTKAVRALKNDLPIDALKNTLKEIVISIHMGMLAEGSKAPDKAGMGSTFIGLLFFKDALFLINIGDSRMYRFRDKILTQLSRDHSLSEMTNNPDAPKNIIVNSFGAGEKVFFDFGNISSRIINDDVIVLCSDGLTTELKDDEIELILSNLISPSLLVAAAKNKEGKDNISVATIQILFTDDERQLK